MVRLWCLDPKNEASFKQSLVFLPYCRAVSGASGFDRQKSVGTIKGQLKLSIEYHKDVLHVMVHHAKDLAIPDGSKDEPNSYV